MCPTQKLWQLHYGLTGRPWSAGLPATACSWTHARFSLIRRSRCWLLCWPVHKVENMSETFTRILAIETSCDETAAAVVENGRTILSNVIASQTDLHAQYGGVFPEVA